MERVIVYIDGFNAMFTIGRKKIADSLFPDQIRKADGYILRRPDEWK